MRKSQETEPRYRIESVVRAFKVLDSLERADNARCLQEVAQDVSLPISTTLRLLRTLESCGVVERMSSHGYRSRLERPKSRARRIGFVVTTFRRGFRKEVADGLAQAAAETGVELVTVDTPIERRLALRNADAMVRAGVDLVVDFQTHGELGQEVSGRYLEAGIPVIAVDWPHHGATFFGVNNFVAAREGGRWMGDWVRRHWQGRLDLVVLGSPGSSSVITSRCRGALMGLHDRLGHACGFQTVEIDASSSFDAAFRSTQKVLARAGTKRVLLIHPTDPGVLGGLTALNEAASRCEVVMLGFGGSIDTRMALRDTNSRLGACIGFMPDRYGPKLLLTALRLLEGKVVPPAVFVEHEILTPENVDLWYPNDRAIVEAPILGSH